MRFKRGRLSDNVEDRRQGFSGRTKRVGGIGTIIIALVAMYFGVDPQLVMQGSQMLGGGQSQQSNVGPNVIDDQQERFISMVLSDTEDTWQGLFRQNGHQYQEPKLVLFNGQTPTACGSGKSAMGPFYCPADRSIYLDLSFFKELHQRFQAPGDFAQAYVLAHEVGHHVQRLLGISEKVQKARRQVGPVKANQLSVRLELQADCFAGVWAHHANKRSIVLEAGDVAEALQAATAIGDDRLQKQAQGYAVPDSFTHGSSAQRVRWFQRGLQQGSLEACNTFKASSL